MTRTAKSVTLSLPLIVSWPAGLLLLVWGPPATGWLPALTVPLVLAGGLWAAMTPFRTRFLRLYPILIAAGVCLAGGPGLTAALLLWGWFWAQAGLLSRARGWSFLLGLSLSVLFFAFFWTAIVWPTGGWGVTVSTYGSPIAPMARAFLIHGADYDPRVSNVLYNLWYGTRFPVALPDWWKFGGVYLLAGILLLSIRLAVGLRLPRDSKTSTAPSTERCNRGSAGPSAGESGRGSAFKAAPESSGTQEQRTKQRTKQKTKQRTN